MITLKDRIIEIISSNAECDTEDAEKIYKAYQREKIMRVDGVDGSFRFSHGAFLERDTLRHAIKLINTGEL